MLRFNALIKSIKILKRPKAFWNLKKYLFFHYFHLANMLYYPTWLEVEVSTKCNLSCPRCEREIVPQFFLGQETPINIINKISPLFPYVKFISLVSGLGEPFLNNNFWEIVKIIKQNGPSVGYTTNGILLNDDNIKKTITERVDVVVVSLDSLKEEVYKKIRTGASLDKVIKNLKSLLRAKKENNCKNLDIRLGFTMQKNNIEEMPKMVEFAKQLGINTVYFTAIIIHKNELINQSLYLLDLFYIKKIFKDTKTTASKLGIEIRLPKIDINDKNQSCYYPRNTMFVAYNGDVFCNSCCRSPQKTYFCVKNGKIINQEIKKFPTIMGNINEESILKIWNNGAYKNLRRRSMNRPCNNCYLYYGVH